MKIYPSVEEIKEKYQSFKTVPVSTEIEADVSALTVLKKLKNVSSHCYMLAQMANGALAFQQYLV